jgi:8-oxo-dGTP pyrophosphatase MutT (NUDIX family)
MSKKMMSVTLPDNFDPVESGSVYIVVFNPENQKYLLLQRSLSDDSGAGLWDIAGGGIDEPDIELSAKRELLEECGIQSDNLDFIGIIDYKNSKGKDKKRFIFAVEFSGSINLSHEHEHYEWVSIGELEKFNFYMSTAPEAIQKYAHR